MCKLKLHRENTGNLFSKMRGKTGNLKILEKHRVFENLKRDIQYQEKKIAEKIIAQRR